MKQEIEIGFEHIKQLGIVRDVLKLEEEHSNSIKSNGGI